MGRHAAVIVEPRNHLALPLVIFQTASILGPEWPIYLFHGTNNLDLALSIQAIEPSLTLISLARANLSVSEYSQLLTDSSFWIRIPTDSHVLVFQTDSLLLRNSPHKIQDFLCWDYVGAPWRHLPQDIGGNGGLSLRRKSAMLAAISRLAGRGTDLPEDLRFCRVLRSMPKYRVAPRSIARTFSVESIFYAHPFGIHKAYARLPAHQWLQLVTLEPWLQDLFKNQKEMPCCHTCGLAMTRPAFTQREFEFCQLECLRKFQKEQLPQIRQEEDKKQQKTHQWQGHMDSGGGDCC